MHNLRRYFYQNREKIYRTILVVALCFFIFWFFANKAKIEAKEKYQSILEEEKREKEKGEVSQMEQSTTIMDNINTNSILSKNEQTSDSASLEKVKPIKEFIDFCNNGDSSSAYNMLSDECKENMYPTLQNFTDYYYKDNFSSNKNYNIQRWIGSTYKVNLKENALHTGTVSVSSKQDYITIVEQGKEQKLNINEYIGRKQINKEKTIENVTIEVLYKDTYREYETYVLQIKNSSDTDVYLDDLEDPSTLHLLDGNGVEHIAYTHELSQGNLHIYPHSQKRVRIKFSNSYISNRQILEMIFEKVQFNDSEETKVVRIEI